MLLEIGRVPGREMEVEAAKVGEGELKMGDNEWKVFKCGEGF